jgi:hypothetical protein
MTPQKPPPKSSAPRSRTPAKSAKQKPASARASKPRVSALADQAAVSEARERPSDTERKGLNPNAELSSEVMEFITAIDEYKRNRRRPFPNWSDIFEIVKALGYNT